MVTSYLLAGSYGQYGLLEADKPCLPEVFHIDDLLDFSCDDIGAPIVGGQLQLSGVSVESCVNAGERSISSSLEAKSELQETALEDVEAKTDLCVPCDDLADLEWLSSFVEDSFTVVDAPEEVFSTYGAFPSALSNNERTPNMKICDAYQPYQKSSPVSVLENSATSSELTGPDYRDVLVPGRARSKRSRTGARTWTSKFLPTSSSANSFESIGGDSYTSYSPIVSEDDASRSSVVDGAEQEDEDSQSSKRCKVANSIPIGSHNSSIVSNVSNSSNKGRKKNQDNAQAWRCMHCQSQKTPQWRTGPMGPKTLCNACGVRYKSGRLLPEYRPASSPTYEASKHSHSHKKVIEMRRERELRQPHSAHPSNLQSVHGATKKMNDTKEQGMNSLSMKHVNSDYQCLETQKCLSKPLEVSNPEELELPKDEDNNSAGATEFLKCVTSTTAALEPRLDCDLDETRGL